MLRTTLIRGGLLALLALLGAALWYAQSYVHPDAVRASLLQSFEQQFPGSQPKIGEAHAGVFSGVSVRGLALTRPEDGQPFFTADRAVIAHDKEKLSGGNMVIRKIELEAPTLRLERRADGRWTFDGLAKPSPADKPVPTFVVTNGTITIVDKSPAGLPPLKLTSANFTLLNDPPPLFLNVKGTAFLTVSPEDGTKLPPVRVEIAGRLHRLSGEFQFRVTATDLAVGPELCGLLRLWRPALAETLATLTAKATVRADLTYKPEASPSFAYDLEVKLKEGRFTDPRLPVPVESLEATARYRDGRLSIEKAAAKLGTCLAELSAEVRPVSSAQLIPPARGSAVPATLAKSVRANSLPVEPDALAEFEQHLEKLDLTLRDLTLSDDLFERFGGRMISLRDRFQPAGVVAVSYRFSRPAAAGWRREFELRPTKFRMTYDRFRYPLHDVAGHVRRSVTSAGLDETVIDLTGTGGGQRLDIKGIVNGATADPGIDLKITGNNVPLDDQLFEALPKLKHQEALKKLRAGGRGDIVAEVRQEAGVNLCHTNFRVQVRGGRFSHTHFAYPLEDVSGLVSVSVATSDPNRPLRPGQPITSLPDTDRIELSDFRGRHGDGIVTLKGVHAAAPGDVDRKLTLAISGQNCPVDADMKTALAGLKLGAVWRTFSPRGKITFAVDVECLDRIAAVPAPLPPLGPVKPPGVRGLLTSRPKSVADDPPFNPATDLTLTLHFAGPSITPDFFPYDFDQVAGRVRYDGVQVRVEKFTAKHGTSSWSLDAGEVRFFSDGRVWGNFGRLDVTPVVPDEAFVKALPPNLQKGVKELNLRGPMDMTLRHLVVLTPPDAPAIQQVSTAPSKQIEEPDPDIYWTGELRLHGAALDAGVAWDKVKGRIASTGRYYGTHLGEVVGNIWLDDALVADHPVQRVKIGYRTDPQTPDPLVAGQWDPVAVKFTDLTGDFFGGQLTGEARVVLSEPVRYKTRLDAVDVKLEDVARHHQFAKSSRFEGLAQASLRLETANDICGCPVLEGAGTLDVDRAHMLNLPFLLPLLKTLKLQAPDKTAFEEAHATFTVRGDRLHVTHLDLIGDAVSIGGSGETDLAGKYVKFDCYTIWSQTLHRWLTTPFGDVSAFLSEKLFRIEISRGGDGKIKYDARLVPFMTDPVRALAERVKRRSTAGKTELNNRVTEAPKTK